MDKYDICYPNYDHCIVNVMSSILKYLGVANKHTPNAILLDKLNNGGYDQVILMLFDGMGSCNIDDHLSEESFLRSHKFCDISSVFPPTTVAAITSIVSESYPNEHGWLVGMG